MKVTSTLMKFQVLNSILGQALVLGTLLVLLHILAIQAVVAQIYLNWHWYWNGTGPGTGIDTDTGTDTGTGIGIDMAPCTSIRPSNVVS